MQLRTHETGGLHRAAIAVAGFSVLLFGVALVVVPIPGSSLVVVPFGLAILAREFEWAQRLLDRLTAAARRIWAGLRRRLGRPFLSKDDGLSKRVGIFDKSRSYFLFVGLPGAGHKQRRFGG